MGTAPMELGNFGQFPKSAPPSYPDDNYASRMSTQIDTIYALTHPPLESPSTPEILKQETARMYSYEQPQKKKRRL